MRCAANCFLHARGQVSARWKRQFTFGTTANGEVLSDSLAVRVSFDINSGLVLGTDAAVQNFSVSSAPESSEPLISALASTKALPILRSPLVVRMSVVGNATEVAGGVVRQAEASKSPLRVRNEGINLVLDVLLEDDVEGGEQLRVSVVRPQVLDTDLEISRVEVLAGAFVSLLL